MKLWVKFSKFRTDISCCLLLVNYGIPSRIVLKKSFCLFIFFFVSFREILFLFTLTSAPFVICIAIPLTPNQRDLRLNKEDTGSFVSLRKKKKSWPQFSSNVHTSQKNVICPMKNIFSKKLKEMKG